MLRSKANETVCPAPGPEPARPRDRSAGHVLGHIGAEDGGAPRRDRRVRHVRTALRQFDGRRPSRRLDLHTSAARDGPLS